MYVDVYVFAFLQDFGEEHEAYNVVLQHVKAN